MNGNLSVEQIVAGRHLWRAIKEATSSGWVVPCTRNPQRWDLDARPEDCYACPVLPSCVRYRQVGIIDHPTVLAGQRIHEDKRRRAV